MSGFEVTRNLHGGLDQNHRERLIIIIFELFSRNRGKILLRQSVTYET